MAILKKQGKCSNCGGILPAGTEVSWKQITLNRRHGGNGTITSTSTRWAPVHSTNLQCEHGVNSEREVVEIYKANLVKLKRQVEMFKEDGDKEMVEFIENQVRNAEKEIASL